MNWIYLRSILLICTFWAGRSDLIAQEPERTVSSTLPQSLNRQTDDEHLGWEAKGDFSPTPTKARESLIEEILLVLPEKLREQKIILINPPSSEWIANELIQDQELRIETTRLEKEENDWIRYSTPIDLKPEHIRMFRKQNRIRWGGFLLGLFIAASGIISLYYKLDDWTKGYLTKLLALGGSVLLLIFGYIWWWFHW